MAKIVAYGDQATGLITSVNKFLETHDMDLLVLLGDYAYEIHNENGVWSDEYFDFLESIATRVPIIMAPGNHEYFDNFKFFTTKFIYPLTKHIASVNNFHFVIKTLFLWFLTSIMHLIVIKYLKKRSIILNRF